MMIKKIVFSHYFLIIVLASCLSGLYLLQLARYTQLGLFLFGSIYYIIWGIGHHTTEGRKESHIFSEYILLGLIGVILTLIVFFPYF